MSDCSLYLISPPALTLPAFLPELEAALATGLVQAFQLRLKNASDTDIRAVAREALPICQAHGVACMMNDRADLAAELGFDGVHLGQDDMKVAEARALIGPDRAIGVSAHASRHLAFEAAEAGADYVAFGAFFPTRSKPPEKIARWGTPDPVILEEWSLGTVIPCVAIGGVTAENARTLVAHGADFLGVITAAWEHPGGAAAGVEAFRKVLENSATA